MDEFPHVKVWMYKLLARPGFEKGRHVPKPHIYLDMNALTEEELNEKAKGGVKWIQEAMKKEAAA